MSRALLLKSLLIAALSVVLMVPVGMIRELIAERQARRDQAVSEIASSWGARQTLVGPYLVVPYERTNAVRTETGHVRIAPEAVDWSIQADTSEKARGIYKARLYTARIDVSGRIAVPARFGIAEDGGKLSFGTPRLVLGVSDARAIRRVSPLVAGVDTSAFSPGAGDRALASGIHAPVPALGAPTPGGGRSVHFSFSFEVGGSEALSVAPLAHDTTIALRADWPHPSFQGVFLPASHAAAGDGFTAKWQISRYAAQGEHRLAGCRDDACPALTAQQALVSFIEPVGVYQRLERAAKYGFLFVGLLFAAFLLFELLRRLMIHPIQYALVGLALAIFFLLLTALSEHIAFGQAYALATLACVGLVTFYVLRVLRSTSAGLAFGAGLGALYGVLYLLIQAEDYSLLGGAALLFGLLALAMFATRKVEWYPAAVRQS